MKVWMMALAGVALCGAAASAHHSIAAVYDGTKSVTIEGVVNRFQFVNPHPVMIVTVADAGGRASDWRLEMDNRSELAAVGITAESLKPGDRVVVTGSPSRGQARSLYVMQLERPADGFGFEQVGGSPRIRPPSR